MGDQAETTGLTSFDRWRDGVTSSAPRALVAAMLMVVLGLAAPRQLSAQPVDHVLHISVDGLHAEQLRTLMQTRPDSFVNFRRLASEGASTFNARTDTTSTFTLPNHTSMLTGRPVRQPADDPTLHHGYLSNSTPRPDVTLHSQNEAVDYIASTFDVAHDYGLSTAMYASKQKFVLYEQSYNVTDQTPGGRADVYLENGDQGINKIDRYVFSAENGSATIVETLRNDYANAPDKSNYTFIHLVEPDAVGHPTGWRSEDWNASVAQVDAHLGQLFDLIDNDPELQDNTAIVLTSDHGGSLFGHSNTTDANTFSIPFFVWGADVPAGQDLYSLNPLTRVSPGDQQIDYTAPEQPIRNGDSGNLALALLGLPPVDGASINARQDLRVEYPVVAVWDGVDASRGSAGDGRSWSDAANWSRKSAADRGPVAGDIVQLTANTQLEILELRGDRTLHSLVVEGDYQLGSGNVALVSGEIDVAAGRRLIMDDVFSTRRSLIKQGEGTLVLEGSMALGDLLVSQGRLEGTSIIANSLANRGVVAPGKDQTLAVLNVERDYTQSSFAALEIQLMNDGVSDQLLVGGTAIYRGELRTQAITDDVLPMATGDVRRWQISEAGRRVGRFGQLSIDGRSRSWMINDPDVQVSHRGDGLFARIDYANDGVMLTIYQTVPGDVDGDGAFTPEDMLSLFSQGGYENEVPNDANWTTGDWDDDDDFTLDDLLVAFAAGAYGQPSILSFSAVAVPEPAGGALIINCLIGFIAWHASQRRRRT